MGRVWYHVPHTPYFPSSTIDIPFIPSRNVPSRLNPLNTFKKMACFEVIIKNTRSNAFRQPKPTRPNEMTDAIASFTKVSHPPPSSKPIVTLVDHCVDLARGKNCSP